MKLPVTVNAPPTVDAPPTFKSSPIARLFSNLEFAANLAAGYLGLKNKIKPSDETKKSVFYDKKSSLPKNMEEAILLFEKDEQISEVFSQKFVRTIAAIRRVEYQAYLKVISSWEREYLLLIV